MRSIEEWCLNIAYRRWLTDNKVDNQHCWHCLHQIPSSLWVVSASCARCWLLTLPASNPIQLVSCECLLCLISIADIACIKSHPAGELWVPPVLDFDCWHCLHQIPPSGWAMSASCALFWLLTLPASNPIQTVSRECLLCLMLIADIACIKSHPESESWAPPVLDFDCWHCLHQIPSSWWVVSASCAWFQLLTLPASNPIQFVSCEHLLCLISIADIACIKSHPVGELWAPPVLDFNCWHCLHQIPSRGWVVSASCAWFQLLTLPASNTTQWVSHECLLCSILIADIACIKSHPGSESWAPPVLDLDCWHCLHQIPSSLWVMSASCALFRLLTLPASNHLQFVSHERLLCSISIADIACIKSSREWVVSASCAWFRLLTLPASNPIQRVSRERLLCSMLIADIACIKSHPGSESWAPPVLYFDCWHCLHQIPSSWWVVSASCAWFQLLTLPASNTTQFVSHERLLCSILIADIACIKSHPVCESWAPLVLYFDCWHCLHQIPSREWVVSTSCALFWLLTLPASNPIQAVSCEHLLCSILIADIACIKSYPGSELWAPPVLDFDCSHCLHQIPSREWVVCTFCAQCSKLTYCSKYYLVCKYFSPLFSFYSFNRPAFHRHMMLKTLFMLNSM